MTFIENLWENWGVTWIGTPPKWIHFIKPKQRIIFILVSPRKLYSSPETEAVNCGTFRTKTHSAYFTLLQYPFKISTKGTKMQSACREICSFWPWSKLCVNCFSFLCLQELHLSLPRSSDLRLIWTLLKLAERQYCCFWSYFSADLLSRRCRHYPEVVLIGQINGGKMFVTLLSSRVEISFLKSLRFHKIYW